MKVRTVRRDTVGPGMESLTLYQAKRTRLRVRTVRRNTAGSGMKSLTFCQANQIGSENSEKGHRWTWHKVTHILESQQDQFQVRTVGRNTARPGMESLTNCQANRTRLGMRTVRRNTAGPGIESLTCCQANRTMLGGRTLRRDIADQLDLA